MGARNMAKCKPCMSAKIKKALEGQLPQTLLDSIAECHDGTLIEFCSKAKRRPSAYTEFTTECMRQGLSMSQCAAKWREKKQGGS